MTQPFVEISSRRPKALSIPLISLGDLTLFAVFFLSLQPFSLSIAGSGVSASFFFLLLFLIPIRRVAMTFSAWEYLFLFCFIFFAGFPGLIFEDNNYQIRTIASFIAFMAPFSLLFIRFREHDLTIFIYAVILSSLYNSMQSINGFLLHGGAGVFSLKGMIGSQRYGFVLCLGFFLALYKKGMGPFLKMTILSIVFAGILLTFSRSSVISLFTILALIGVMNIPTSVPIIRTFKPKTVWRVFILGVALTFMIYQFRAQIGKLWDFFDVRLVSMFLSGKMFEEADTNIASSEGYRIYLWSQILSYLSNNPFTGSNFSGLYLLFEEHHGSASAHSQYMDVLLRTGLIGFSFYSFILYKIARYFRNERGVFYGFLAILVYGVMHETFKLGQGGFIFGFLLSYRFWMVRNRSSSVDMCSSVGLK